MKDTNHDLAMIFTQLINDKISQILVSILNNSSL